MKEQLWWLSFADDRFLGVAIVWAESMELAIIKTHHLGINPGGQVAGRPIAGEWVARVRECDINRLLTKQETAVYGGGKTTRERDEQGVN